MNPLCHECGIDDDDCLYSCELPLCEDCAGDDDVDGCWEICDLGIIYYNCEDCDYYDDEDVVDECWDTCEYGDYY
jgi:predicted carbohydrate-binding protein with CBM5 and CBM33 domain